ncbi:MAG: ATP-binding cassette domain-containing protein [Bacteroidaceae bacterium]|nr:ATP-binding cassette domain-containing protein [Bacteroidaceae bacterium]
MITIKDLTFAYGKKNPVLQDFSLDFQRGNIYGLLGKNGTGKSTLLYLIMGLLHAQKGEVLVDGMSAKDRKPELMREMFLLPEEYDLPAVHLSDYVSAIAPFYPNFSMELMEKCLSCFEMSTDVNLGSLSMGQKKKVYMCIALAANTPYLFMDEPTNGLDILSKSQFRKAIVTAMSPEKTIIVSTHQVHDVERVLDHVVIIDRNRVLLNQSLVENEEPVDLEKLFVDTLTHNSLQQ